MTQKLSLRPHPRLFGTPERIARLKDRPTLRWLQGIEDWLREKADEWLDMPPFADLDRAEFGYCTYIGREHEMRVSALAIRWLQSGEERYRKGVLDSIRWMQEHDGWSEVFEDARDFDPTACFDLNHGERALTLAMACDWLYDSLNPAEKSLFRTIAATYVFAPALKHCRDGGAWWYAKPHNNWNGVCAGGLGMLCLALYDDCDEARELLPRVEYSLKPFIEAHGENTGASEEGTGYWNYGMRYAGLYLRSWEEATGGRHPLLDQPWLERCLTFPLDFSPNGMDVGFGDIPGFGQPLPFHYDLARSRGLEAVVRRINARLKWHDTPARSTNTGTGLNYWDSLEGATPLWLLVHDRVDTPAPATEEAVAKVFPGLDWGLLANRMPDPDLYLSVRGGNAGAAHAHDDLLSFHCCVGREVMIGNPKPSKYLPTTFTIRRGEIPDINPQFKNTMLIDGVGIHHGTKTDSVELVEGPRYKGIRMVATTAFTTPAGSSRPRNMSRLDFVGRLFLMLDNRAWLIVDSVVSAKGGPSLCEARFLTHAEAEFGEHEALLTGTLESMRISFASNVRSFLATATTAPTTARDRAATLLRWCADEHVRAIAPRTTLLAALLTPGRDEARVGIEDQGHAAIVSVTLCGQTMAIPVGRELTIAKQLVSGPRIA